MNISSLTPFMDDTFNYIIQELTPFVPEYFKTFAYTPWVFSILGSIIIGLSGILPLLIIPDDTHSNSSSNRKLY